MNKEIVAYQPNNCQMVFKNFQTSTWDNGKKTQSYFSDGLSGIDNLKTPRGVAAIWKIKPKLVKN